MKSMLGIIFLVLFTVSAADSPVFAQAAPADSRPLPNQWLSHQMNQPPPDPPKRTILSDEIIEEIRQLYLQAQKELEQKTATQKNTQ
ncbi:MAG: hypothetical protein LDL33_06295 [Desulfomonile sp.]|nr:hypothetical protein [Desulfomonile sp.]